MRLYPVWVLHYFPMLEIFAQYRFFTHCFPRQPLQIWIYQSLKLGVSSFGGIQPKQSICINICLKIMLAESSANRLDCRTFH